MAERRRVPPPVRKLALAGALALAAAGVARYRAGPAASADAGPAPVERVASVLANASGLEVHAESLQLVPALIAPWGPGAPVAAVFTATAPGSTSRDVYRAVLRTDAQGTPLVLGRVVNLTRTPDSDEHLLDAGPGCLLYAPVTRGRPIGAVLLDFDVPESTPTVASASLAVRALAAVSAWQAYGTPDPPTRFDLALATPATSLSGRCTELGASFQVDEHVQLVLTRDPAGLEPAAAGTLRWGGPPPSDVLSLLADALRSSEIVGTARVAALEAALFDLRDWLLRMRHGLFPTAEDRQPVTPSLRAPAARVTGWPPGPLSVPHEEAVAGEGEWTDPLGELGRPPGGEGPLALRTFLRVDAERPYERVYLFAFDMRRLALHFTAGTEDPRSTTGVRGRGSVRPEDRPHLVAAFNGGFKAEHGSFGAVEQGKAIVPPAPGLATVATDPAGRARFGIWDLGPVVPADVVDLRQNLSPLLAGGVVNPQRTRNWGQLVARLDASQTPRTAVGVTDGGVLMFGWAPSTSAELLGEAMRRAGVQFAVHLDMNPHHTGLELYAPGDDPQAPRSLRGAPEMDYRERRWLEEDARDFFYLVEAPREQRPTSEPQDLGVATPEGPDAPVRLWRLDAVRPQSIPGLAEPAPVAAHGSGAAPRSLKLPGAPVLWIDSGARAVGAELGLVVGGRVWRPAVPGLPTLTVDAEGVPRVGPWPAGGEAQRFPELLQGTPLVSAGALAVAAPEAAPASAGEPAVHHEAASHGGARDAVEAVAGEAAPERQVALGQDAQGRLLLAAGAGTSPAGLARALVDAGAVEAMLLTGKSTPETGRVRFFQLVGEQLYQADRPMGRKEPADLRPGAGMVLVFTPRALPARARVVQTFKTEAK